MYYTQSGFDIRCEWGLEAVERLAPVSDVVIIIDVLSFTSCVDIAVSRGATVYPYRSLDGEDKSESFAQEKNAILASKKRDALFSLSPHSLLLLPYDSRLVLPSPNGSTLSLATGDTITFAACLRNARAVAHAAQSAGKSIAVIPAGERWIPDFSLRPALEDWLGAGAVIRYLRGNKSPEAQSAELAFSHFQDKLMSTLQSIGSGIELIEKGFAQDVELAAMLNVSKTIPRLINGTYQRDSNKS